MLGKTCKRFLSFFSVVSAFIFTGQPDARSFKSGGQDNPQGQLPAADPSVKQSPSQDPSLKVKPRMVAPERPAGIPTKQPPSQQDPSLKVKQRMVFPEMPAPERPVLRVIGPGQMESVRLEQFLPEVEDQKKFAEWAAARNLQTITSEDVLLVRMERIMLKLSEIEEKLNK